DWGHPYEFHKIIYGTHVGARNHERALARPDWIEPTLMRMILDAAKITGIEYVQATLARTTFAEKVRATFERYDLLLTPQMPDAAGAGGGVGRPPRPLRGPRRPRWQAGPLDLRPGAVHVPVQPDRPASGQRAVRLHAGAAAGRTPDRGALAPGARRLPCGRRL